MAEPRWFTIKEVAERLRVSRNTVARMIKREELPAIRVSARVVRISAPALERLELGATPTPRPVVRRRVLTGVRFGDAEQMPIPYDAGRRRNSPGRTSRTRHASSSDR